MATAKPSFLFKGKESKKEETAEKKRSRQKLATKRPKLSSKKKRLKQRKNEALQLLPARAGCGRSA